MNNYDYKTTNSLMSHLRNSGVEINGGKEKRELINYGYYHGYKGYRFFNNKGKLPFTTFKEIIATIEYDSKLKALLYGKIMLIETAIKNIALNSILIEIKSNSVNDMYNKVVSGYKDAKEYSEKEATKLQKNKLDLQVRIQNELKFSYSKNNPKISHFYNNKEYNEVPLWAIFEILSMGDFGYLIQCLTKDMREKIAIDIGINLASDTNRELVYKYVYALKDLRNAIAHNHVIYDTRFKKMDPSTPMKKCLKEEFNLPYINFKTFGDYIILVCYFLKLIKVSKTEIKAFIREYEKLTAEYRELVSPDISSVTLHTDLESRMNILKNCI